MPVTIRKICEEDSAAYNRLARALDAETSFLLYEPGERQTTDDEQRERIRKILAAENQMLFLAEAESGTLVGVLGAAGGSARRSRATVHIFIGILQSYTGQGIGTRLFQAAEEWARAWGARRLELTVMCHNERALALYRKMGFVIEGRRRDALKVDGQYVDEFSMAKILEEPV